MSERLNAISNLNDPQSVKIAPLPLKWYSTVIKSVKNMKVSRVTNFHWRKNCPLLRKSKLANTSVDIEMGIVIKAIISYMFATMCVHVSSEC